MMDVSGGIYEVLNPQEDCGKSPVGNGKARTNATFPKGYSTYAVPRGVNGTPPRTRTIPPAVPPRNRNVSEGDIVVGSLGSSPNDKQRSFARTLSYSGITKSPSFGSISEELSLNSFINKYGKYLPHRVKVCKGFYGVSDQTAVTTGDVLNLHFLKTTKVVQVETGPNEGCTSYNVPLTSAIHFSPLYDPNDRIEEAKRGFFFGSVADIMAMKTLPKIVRAMRSFQGGSSESSVAENELLLVKFVKNKLTGKQLRVFSLTSNRKKTLSENCQGSFTTAPDKLYMYLYEITVNLAEALPCKALVTMFNSAHQDSVLDDLQGAIVTLKKTITETSVIATSSNCDDDGDMTETAEMPVSLDIEVEAVPLDEEEVEHLRTDTSIMYENFDPFSVCLYMTKSSRRLYDIQCMLYTKLMHGNDCRGLEIVRPHSISTISTPTKKHAPNLPLPPPNNGQAPLRSASSQSSGSQSSGSSNPPSVVSTPTSKLPPNHQSSGSTSSSTSSGYQSLNSPPKAPGGSAGDYYVVMSSGTSGNRAMSQDDVSDQSGDSVISHRDQLRYLEGHNNNLEATVAKNNEEIKRLNKVVDHLNRRIESVLNQIRIMSTEDMASIKIPSRSPSGSPPVSVDNRPPAPLPAPPKRNGRLAPPTQDDCTYHIVGGSMESISSSSSPPADGHSHMGSIYMTPQNHSMNNKDYLAAMGHQKVLELLDAMCLRQYREQFKSEMITGEILLECDDEMLTSDLGVSSKLHRKRLMKVISGHHSAKCILNGEDPYLERKANPEVIERSK